VTATQERNTALTCWRSQVGNWLLFQHAAAGAGCFNPRINADATVRRVVLLPINQLRNVGDRHYLVPTSRNVKDQILNALI
jgi:hypothetical protein